MSQTSLAASLGISAAHIGHIERGSRHASLETMVAISQQLEVPLDVLIFPDRAAETMRFAGLKELRTLILNAHLLIDDLVSSAVD